MNQKRGRLAVRAAMLLVGVFGVVASARPIAAAPRAEPAAIPTQPPRLPGAPLCGPSKADWATEPSSGRNAPTHQGPIYFAPDFPLFLDDAWGAAAGAVGGFGGIRFRAPLRHTPVIFVHGNQADAQNWLDTMQQFSAAAGYTMQEMYALSYNALGNYYAGAPAQMQPSALDQAYLDQNVDALANGGHGAADEDEVPDLCRFVEAVQWYTGSHKVDIVAHSLGVTITRRLMQLYPSLARDVVGLVGIAGANHGTTVCRGLDTSYYGCNEIAPGTQWLARLNAAGETYGPTHWMTVYAGAEGDPFFVGPDVQSPPLDGADNRSFNVSAVRGDYHNDLRVDPPEVLTYLAFLLRHGQAGPGAAGAGDAQAASLEQQAQQSSASYSLSGGSLCIPDLTGTQDGCTLAGVPSGNPPSTSSPPLPAVAHPATVASLPDTAGAGVPALAGVLAVLALLSGSRCRRPSARSRTSRPPPWRAAAPADAESRCGPAAR
jgi:pimeloyl-ACP methyl ester carboxylesterase